jgi:hypothetical protein
VSPRVFSAGGRALALVGLFGLGAACTRYGSLDRSKGFTGNETTASLEDVPVRGHDIDIEHAGQTTSGELLAVDDLYLYVLTDGRVRAIERRKVTQVSVELYASQAGQAGLWTALGTVSTVSHGFFLVITAPVWLATGISVTAGAAATNDLEVRDDKLGPLYQFARFPQGLPPTWPGARVPLERSPPRVAPQTDAGVDAADASAEGTVEVF